MRKHIKLFFCGLTLTLMTIPSTSAQEFIREFYSLKDWKTIIREIQQDEWLLYRNYEDIRSAFCIVTPSGTSSPMLWFTEQMSFRDFEILDGKYVYFCGMRVNDSTYLEPNGSWGVIRRRNALFGYFKIDDITNPPSGTPIPCYLMEEFANVDLECLDKLEILPVAEGIHLVMTGTTKSGQGCIVDAAAPSYFPFGWDIYVDTSSTGEKFDDVASLDDYIVVTSRFPINYQGFINYFPLPTSFSQSTINSTLYRGELNYTVNDTLLVKHCKDNVFVTGSYSTQQGGIVISGYNFNVPIYSNTLQNITSLAPELQLQDISYNRHSMTLDVLQHIDYTGSPASVVWHLDQTLGSSGILTNSHLYTNEILHSIVCQEYNPNYTIASGEKTSFVRYYQFLLNYNLGCSETFKVPYIKFFHFLEGSVYSVREKTGHHAPEITPTSNPLWPVTKICLSIL